MLKIIGFTNIQGKACKIAKLNIIGHGYEFLHMPVLSIIS